MGKEFLTFKTSSPAGDLISILPAVKRAYEKTGKPCIIYQRLNMIGGGYNGAIHPYKDEEGNDVCMPESVFNMMRPLLISQPYIEDFIVFEGQEHIYDVDKIRLETFTNQPQGLINRWIFYAFPDLACDLSKAWLNAPRETSYENKIIVNFTERYRNNFVNYFFLRKYEKDIIFAGLPNEHEMFCTQWKLNVPLLKVDNFYELAQAINSCKFFLGNASMCFQIAEALKVPRILETFQLMPNVIPIGEKAYDFYGQQGLEFYVHDLFN